MNLLSIVQTLHREARFPGNSPAGVTGQTGRAADLVRWSIEAYNDIQRQKDGRWKWLRADWQVDTTADDPSYATGGVTDVASAAPIKRFRAWEMDQGDPPFIYLVSEGVSAERELLIQEWPLFRRQYVRATHTSAPPVCIAVDPADNLHLGPTPDGVYRVRGSYWKSSQALATDTDTPEMPADYHMLVVYRALVKYGYNSVAQDVLARARTEGTAIYESLVNNQWYGRFRLQIAGALA